MHPGGKGSQYIGLTTWPHLCANCLIIWEPQPPVILTACPGLYRDSFTFQLLLLAVFKLLCKEQDSE